MSDKTIDDGPLRAMLEGLRCGSVHITADRCTGDSRAVEAFCDLVRAAPALAAEVLRLRGEIERRDADHAEMECREIERHQRMCAALDIPEEDRAYATDADVEAAATDAVCERDALAAKVLRLRERAEKAEAERDALRAAVRAAFAVGSAARAAADARFASPSAEAEAEWERALARGEAATERLRALAGEGGR